MTENIYEVELFAPYRENKAETNVVQIRCGSRRIAVKYIKNRVRSEKREWRKCEGFLGDIYWRDYADRCLSIRVRRLYK